MNKRYSVLKTTLRDRLRASLNKSRKALKKIHA